MDKTKLKPIINALRENPDKQVSVDRQWLISCLHELSVYRWRASGAVFRNKKRAAGIAIPTAQE